MTDQMSEPLPRSTSCESVLSLPGTFFSASCYGRPLWHFRPADVSTALRSWNDGNWEDVRGVLLIRR